MASPNIIIACNQCRTKNRIPLSRIHDNPICARCKASLSGIPFKPIDVDDSTFKQEVLEHTGTVLVDCWAPWCGPCRSIGPILEALASEFAGQIKIVKINMDQNPIISSKYAIQSIPTMLFFTNGKRIDSLIGAYPKKDIVNKIKSII